MKLVSLTKKERAISSALSAIILFAVTLIAAAAAAFWMSGIAGTYAEFEMFEIESAYAPKEATCWNITLGVRNLGSSDVTLINAFINNKLIGDYSPVINCTQITSGVGLTIKSGQQVIVYMQVPLSLFSSGTTLNVKLHSVGGIDNTKFVELA